jgi:hypothetical protein
MVFFKRHKLNKDNQKYQSNKIWLQSLLYGMSIYQKFE